MSYQVLARKWRPRTFSEMVGQEHVLRALVNALDNDRLHHAYLFTGTRGIGKTTVARVFAKALNCDRGVSSEPCGECEACVSIDEGRFVDLIEVDAASRTGVDDTRELLDNVQYAPARGRYKVYLIDEVHMFSKNSFNALLKTLEEPPPHVKFLLATTDPKKLPVTVLSRCLQFNLKRMAPGLIAEHLGDIAGRENVEAEPEALQALARAADGSMRDALSLADQAIAYSGGSLRAAEVCTMLGTIDRQHVLELAELLANGDGAGLLQKVSDLAEQSPDFGAVLEELVSLLQRIAVAQIVPDGFDQDAGDSEAIKRLAASMTPEDTQLYYQIGLNGLRDLRLSPDPCAGLEMILLRMLAFRPVSGTSTRQKAATVPAGNKDRQAAAPGATPADTAPVTAAATATRDPAAATWEQMIEAMQLNAMVRQLAANCIYGGRNGNVVELVLDAAHKQLRGPGVEERLQQALQKYFDAPVRLQIQDRSEEVETPAKKEQRARSVRQQAAVEAIEKDANVQALKDMFGGSVLPESIEPVE